MGWEFCYRWSTVKKAREEYFRAVKEAGYTIHASSSRAWGRHVWSILERDGRKFIELGLFKSQQINGRKHWGVKTLIESEHPFYYDCPVKFLYLAPIACQEWRDRVLFEEDLKSKDKAKRSSTQCEDWISALNL